MVLAGGEGRRLGSLLGSLPKPLLPAAGRPFLEWVLRWLARQGISEAVLSAGFRSQAVADFSRRAAVPGLRLCCSVELSPLGTAGGFLHAAGGFPGKDPWLVCNGDSLVLAGLEPLYDALKTPGVKAAILAVGAPDAGRYGSLEADADGRLVRFAEKRKGKGLINAGVYLLAPELLERCPDRRPLSFETDVFPAWLAAGVSVAVCPASAPFLDIGTEETLAQADAFVSAHPDAFS